MGRPYGGRRDPVLYDPAVPAAAPDVAVRAWKPPIDGIREVLHARFRDHAYPLHTHDTWTLFIVDDGRIRYDLDRREGAADPRIVSVLPPHVVHDGRPGAVDGYRKRVVYLETTVLGEELIGRAVDRPVVGGEAMRDAVSALHDALVCIDDTLDAETRLALVADAIRSALGAPLARSPLEGHRAAALLREYLDARLFERVTLAAAAGTIGSGAAHLARSFTDAFGIAPHRYVIGRRLDAARDRILAGQPLADVAAEMGFSDQAHLTRAFRRFLGTTPAAFAGTSSRRSRVGRPIQGA